LQIPRPLAPDRIHLNAKTVLRLSILEF
jgi:hypothetical protein